MLARVEYRQSRTPRLADQRHSRETEVLPQGLEVTHVVRRAQSRRVLEELRATRTPLIIEDNREPIRQRLEIGPRHAHAQTRTAVEHDRRVAAVADHAIIQPDTIRT